MSAAWYISGISAAPSRSGRMYRTTPAASSGPSAASTRGVPLIRELLGACTTTGLASASTGPPPAHASGSTTTGHHRANGRSSSRSGVETKTSPSKCRKRATNFSDCRWSRATSCQAGSRYGDHGNRVAFVRFGQTIEQTLRDEVFQEYGAAVLEFEELGRREVFREQDGEPTHWIAFDFLVRVDRSQVRNGEPHKFEAIEWFKPDTLPSPLHSQLPFTLAKYQRVLENLPIAS